MRLKTTLLVALGFLFLALGAIGMILPVWPTTPFVLAAAGCFSGSPRLRAWVMGLPFFREHIINYENRTGLSRKTVWLSLGVLWAMLLLSMFLTKTLWHILLLLGIGAGVTVHILWMAKARKPKDKEEKK